MFCLHTLPLARPAQAKIQMLKAICSILKLIPWNEVNLSQLYKDATLGIVPNQLRTNLKNFFQCAPLSKGPRNLLRKTCKGWGPIINPRSSFVDPSVLRFNARFTRGKSHWDKIIYDTNVPILYKYTCIDVALISNLCWNQTAVNALGTIQVLHHHVFDFFRPTHPTLWWFKVL